ncbi:hypothetical protein [Streptomyces antibioticus]|uniref:Uncharacterized protein n=1 Tax=Streptomyces antibioticus TaxID=1890 RepID=A0AAE7CIT5_STRAT|nr:hypothetical protein [Streptomyces antibioticus]QIT42499.1 hypothetical protein HCX60_02360 [Streptomyces antibioticus]
MGERTDVPADRHPDGPPGLCRAAGQEAQLREVAAAHYRSAVELPSKGI